LYWNTDFKNQKGFLFGLFFTGLFSIRFLVEFVKESQGGFEDVLGLISTGQWLSIPFILIGIFFMIRSKKSA
jgi:prolipoprotein diacylglyceryltransferase